MNSPDQNKDETLQLELDALFRRHNGEFQILTAASMLNNQGTLETIGNVVGN